MQLRGRLILPICGLIVAGIALVIGPVRSRRTRISTSTGEIGSHVEDRAQDPAATSAGGSLVGTQMAPRPGTGIRGYRGKTNMAIDRGVDLEKIPSIQKLILDADPRARDLFESGLSYLNDGKFVEARLAFQVIVRQYPESGLEAPAHFAIGLSWYQEGDTENLLLAADQFKNLLLFFPREPELEELRRAAQVDVAVIDMQLMRSEDSFEHAMISAEAAAGALKAFLLKWPNDPLAPSVSASLIEVQRFMAGRR